MEFQIINKQIIGRDIKRLDVQAEAISQKVCPGQFVMVAPEEDGKWIPLTVVDADARRGMISLIFQEHEHTTRVLGKLGIHETLFSVAGPFGKPSEIKQLGVVICIATGVGAAQILPMAKAYKKAGNKVIGILSAATRKEIILEPQMRMACHRIFITTEDGSYQRRGTAIDVLREVLDREEVHLVYTVSSVERMREIAHLTKERQIPNLIQVQTVMSCGRGICGSCRVKVRNSIELSCEEGPEFDAHVMDFDYLKRRMIHVKEEDELVPAKGIQGFWKRFLNE